MTERKPNVLFIMTDQERYAPPYEDEAMRSFRRQQMPAREALKAQSVQFERHYIASAACSPSRTCLFTGQYAGLHQVSQTYGLAKDHDDPAVYWLEPRTLPTMGDYFRAAGYDTVYKGKWHVSYENIINADGSVAHGPESVPLYEKKDALDKFGFTGWIGPEPHGSEKELLGLSVDRQYSVQVESWLEKRDQQARAGSPEAEKPWLLVASLVNPHDVALAGPLWEYHGLPVSDPSVPKIPAPPSRREDLSTKPRVQKKYRDLYYRAMTDEWMLDDVTTQYYLLMKKVDKEIQRILDALKRTSFANDTIIVFTSDHGEQLGAHSLQAKWHNGYEETVHVPLYIRHPKLHLSQPLVESRVLSSHVDLIPTLLGLIGADPATLQRQLALSHSEVHPFAGQNLADFVLRHTAQAASVPASLPDAAPIYFEIGDEIFKGNQQLFAFARLYKFLKNRPDMQRDPIYDCAVHLEGIVAWLPFGESQRLFKLVRYYDNPAYWSEPYQRDVAKLAEAGREFVKTTPLPEEWELYDLTADPTEQKNLLAAACGEGVSKAPLDAAALERLVAPKPYASVVGPAFAILQEQRATKQRKRNQPLVRSTQEHSKETSPGPGFFIFAIFLYRKRLQWAVFFTLVVLAYYWYKHRVGR
eukprot:TRINITY_DN5220_c0_g1_i1.p1 TRINITY_DN5220_c0_g1~~TRINITY_DN5220_c0_g1_i1.p1  ORF type:complete len:642 (-),score=128.71 TRINITY_DN5220_c0_g1_i1:29-1954(-)